MSQTFSFTPAYQPIQICLIDFQFYHESRRFIFDGKICSSLVCIVKILNAKMLVLNFSRVSRKIHKKGGANVKKKQPYLFW